MRIDLQEVLWELPGPEDGPAPPDDDLRAYRSGRLSAAESERIEWMLARGAAGRARLAAMAGVVPAPPPDRLRRRLFAGNRPSRAVPALDWRWAAACCVVAIAAASLLFLPRVPDAVAPLPGFEVRVEGLAETRSVGGTAQARPGSAVRIVIEAEGKTVPGLDYAVYRMDGTRLERLAAGREIELEIHRGGAVLATTGERLAGTEPGEHAFFVAVAFPAGLPERLVIEPGQDPAEVLARACAGRVVRRTLRIVPIEDQP